MKILVINAGSSSLKYQLIDTKTHSLIAKGLCERIGIPGSRITQQATGKQAAVMDKDMPDHAQAIKYVLEALLDKEIGVISNIDEINAVGHRVVHGGELFSESAIIDEQVKKNIEDCVELAPLHNPPNLTGILACEAAMHGVPQVAVFDTAFHQTMPPEAFLYAIPYSLYEKYKIRKYGFHGTSHKYVCRRTAELLNKPVDEVKLIICHLGNGSSVCAVKDGKSVDTTMGMTPLAGVIMGTRCGDIDPAICTYLMEKEHISAHDINDILNKKSGVLGVSGLSSDFRDLEQAAEDGDPRAIEALDMFAYSIKKSIGSYAAVLNGIDALVFTAGIGENNGAMRARIASGLSYLGIDIDLQKNDCRGMEIDVSSEKATTPTWVVPTNEELMIAIDTEMLIHE